MSGGEVSVAQPHRTRHSAQATQAHPQHATHTPMPCHAHGVACVCMHVARTRHVHGAAHVDKLQLANPSPNQLRTSPSGILSAKTRSSMTMEESLGAALARRSACAARGGAKADAPARRSMNRGDTIGAAMSDARCASRKGARGGITTDPTAKSKTRILSVKRATCAGFEMSGGGDAVTGRREGVRNICRLNSKTLSPRHGGKVECQKEGGRTFHPVELNSPPTPAAPSPPPDPPTAATHARHR